MDEDTIRTASPGRWAKRRWASCGSVSRVSGRAGPSGRPRAARTTAHDRSSATRHSSDQSPSRPPPEGGTPPPTRHRVRSRQNAVGSQRANTVVTCSGSGHRPHGSTTTPRAPRSMAPVRNPLTTLETQRWPSCTTTSGTWSRANRSERRMPSAAPTTGGPVRRSPDRGSASRGQPRASERASTASGSPQPAPATIRPWDPGRRVPASTRERIQPSRGRGVPTVTACHGDPSGRPAATPLRPDGSVRRGSRKGRFRWTGPGPLGPEVASPTVREARGRHDDRVTSLGTPGSANQRTDRP